MNYPEITWSSLEDLMKCPYVEHKKAAWRLHTIDIQ